NLEIETLYYPFLYFKAYDNVMNVSSMGVIENNFFSAKLYPNPVRKDEFLNILFPASIDKISIYTIAGFKIDVELINKGITSDGYQLYQLEMDKTDLASGTYIITGETLGKKTYYLKFSYIK
ncbi:T9SS type A sorting domain-containing protein, partial [bacterium]|nr:T9SS type A sorting domain-containing protein [bacterium]